jgi:hypothetical protein
MEMSGKLHISNDLPLGKESPVSYKTDKSVSSSEVISASGEREQDRQYMYSVTMWHVHVMFIPHQLS